MSAKVRTQGKTVLTLKCGCKIEDLHHDVYDALEDFAHEVDGSLGWACPKHGFQSIASIGRRYW